MLFRSGAALHRRHLAHVFEVFRAHRLEPIVFKGWAVARLYAEEAFRPYADIDLCVRPQDEAAARAAHGALTEDCSLDLHAGLRLLDDRPLDEVFRRSQEVPLEGGRVRVLGPEDHLRVLALHMLGHDGWRPVWLTDIAVALENRPANFDWDAFQSGSARRTEWVCAALRLAHELLGAEMTGVPLSIRHGQTPQWAITAILEAWGRRRQAPQGARTPMRLAMLRPLSLLGGLWIRWPGPLEATVGVGAAMNGFPRWPVQLAECLARVGRFLRPRARGRSDRAHSRPRTALTAPRARG